MSSEEDEWREYSCDEEYDSSGKSEEEEEEDFNFQVEMGAFGEGGRVGYGNNNLVSNAPRNYIERNMMPALDKFTMYVHASAHTLAKNCDKVNFDENDYKMMVLTASKIDNVGHINPQAYILGYLATRQNKSLTIESFKTVSKLISTKEKVFSQIENVAEEDIVKYSRLWERLY